jgi:hypothetical protein
MTLVQFGCEGLIVVSISWKSLSCSEIAGNRTIFTRFVHGSSEFYYLIFSLLSTSNPLAF